MINFYENYLNIYLKLLRRRGFGVLGVVYWQLALATPNLTPPPNPQSPIPNPQSPIPQKI